MATAAKATVYPHIEKTDGVRAGKPCIVGTRIAVVDVAIAHGQGYTAHEIQSLFSSRRLTLAEIHAALAYHYDHPKQLEDYLRRSEQAEEQIATLKAKAERRQAGR
jgi:uncharacterized protein (DUF433 family)